MTLEDKLWDVLDKVGLGETFDKHGIPPIVFPIAIIVVIALVAFLLLSSGGAPPYTCGDGICHELENEGNNDSYCPEDCTPPEPPIPPSRDIKVYIDGGTTCSSFKVTLQDQSGKTIGSPRDITTRSVTFEDIEEKSVQARVSSEGSTKDAVPSDYINTESKSSIRVYMPDEYCQDLPKSGNLKVKVKDFKTGESITASVKVFDSGDSEIQSKTVSGEATFVNLEPSIWYYLTAKKDGYKDYYGKEESFLISENSQLERTISMEPLSVQGATGELLVCVSGEDGPVDANGEITVYTLDDDMYTTGKISECPLGRGGSEFERCFNFKLPAGQQFRAAVTRAPSGCSISEKEGPFLIEENDQEIVTIRLNCNLIGTLRAIVYANDSVVVTDNCTVELYYENGTKIRTLNMSSDGNYTETVPLGAGDEVYVHAKNVPDGYLATKSRDIDIHEGENETVIITLNTPPPPLPDLIISGAAVSTQILTKGENFTMKADSVKLEGVTLTNESNLVVTCEGSWNQKRTAVYNNTDWICFNLSAPDTEGTKQIVIKAAMGGADPDSKSFDLFVVNDTSQYLDVDAKEFSTWQSPVSLSFAINYTDPDEGSTAVTQLYEQSLEIFYEDSGGLIVNTTLTGGSNGIYESRFEVPFAGGYTYTLNVKTVIDDVLYESLDVNGFFDVLQGSGATIALDVDPELTKPNGMVNVSIEFTLAGEPLKDQELEVVITGRGEVETYNINDENWNDETEKYERTIDLSDFTSECIYIINVSSDADRSLNDDSILYVADPDAVGTNKEDCPVNPSRCDNLQDVRNCYQFLEDNPQAGPDEIGFVKQCAVKGLPYCEGGSSGSTTCIQGLKLKVEQGSATTPDLFFRIPGSTDGSTSTGLSYTMPSGSGDYYMTLVHMPGGEIEGGPEDGIDAINNVQSLSNIALLPLTISSGGDLNVTAFCPVNCGGVGDLDNYDGAFKDGDIAAMATVIDTLQLIGETPYDEDELSCVDINGDGYITLEDYECISTNGISCSDCEVDSDLEICNDYVDNNCDGQIDSETYDNDAESLYSLSSGVIEDLCSCTSKTPCEMLYSVSNGNYEITNEDDTKRCVSLNGEAYSWKTQSQWQCDLSKANNYLECDGTPYVCQEVSDSYVWLKGGGAGTYPLGDLDLSKCYNEVCDSDETCSNCPNDCGACCGNGACGSGETCNSCFQDCSQIQSVWSTSCGSNCNYVHVQASNLPGNIGDTFGHTYASLSQFSFSKISDDEVKMTSGVWNTGREILISGLNSGSIKLTYSGSTICI